MNRIKRITHVSCCCLGRPLEKLRLPMNKSSPHPSVNDACGLLKTAPNQPRRSWAGKKSKFDTKSYAATGRQTFARCNALAPWQRSLLLPTETHQLLAVLSCRTTFAVTTTGLILKCPWITEEWAAASSWGKGASWGLIGLGRCRSLPAEVSFFTAPCNPSFAHHFAVTVCTKGTL